MKFRPYSIILGLIVISLSCCKSRYDPDLEVPDSSGTDYHLTPLGCLLYGPWEPFALNPIYNVSVYNDDTLIASYPQDYGDEESNLVFKLLKDGSIQRWTKRDYLNKDLNKGRDGITIVSHNKPKDGEIRNIYHTGHWEANFKDSMLTVSTGMDQPHQLNIRAKFISLGSSELKLATTTSFDTTVNGKQLKCKKIVTKYYTHPWIDGFE